jgi:hypothetical protein
LAILISDFSHFTVSDLHRNTDTKEYAVLKALAARKKFLVPITHCKKEKKKRA